MMGRDGTQQTTRRLAAPTEAAKVLIADEHGRSLRRVAIGTAVVGVVHSVLFLTSLLLLRTVPGPKATNEDIVSFYSSDDRRRVVLVGLYLMPFAGIAFMWFIVSLRTWIAASVPSEHALFSNMQLVSGVVFMALFFSSAAAMSITAASVEFVQSGIDPVVARLFPQYGSTLLLVFAIRMAAMFVLTTTSIGRAFGIMPKWLLVIGYALGLVLLLSVSFSVWLVLAFPGWMMLLSLFLLQRARGIPAPAPPGVPDAAGRGASAS